MLTSGILFTLPIYEGNIKPAFMTSLMALQESLIAGQLPHDFMFMTNESLIQRARNNCLAQFYQQTDYSHMMFIDSDIEFTPDDVAKLWGHAVDGHDLVCGLYRMKKEGATYAAWKGGGQKRDVMIVREKF